jgi:hypothetical protein
MFRPRLPCMGMALHRRLPVPITTMAPSTVRLRLASTLEAYLLQTAVVVRVAVTLTDTVCGSVDDHRIRIGSSFAADRLDQFVSLASMWLDLSSTELAPRRSAAP